MLTSDECKTDIRDNEDIRVFVYAFYDKLRKHERLGHIFNEVAQVDWDSHLPRMVDFWSNLIFRKGRFSRQPFRKHLPLPIVFQDFGSWLGLTRRNFKFSHQSSITISVSEQR